MSTDTTTSAAGAPPAWVNSMMTWMLRTPLLEKIIGQGLALLTVTGRRTGRTYTFPVSYRREDATVTIITKRERIWWRNLLTNPDVELRLAGRRYSGRAHVDLDGDDAVHRLMTFLTHRPVDARAFGVTLTREGLLEEDKARSLQTRVVIVEVSLSEPGE